jgi:uncharacterized protein YjbJ (UPF0337 family)
VLSDLISQLKEIDMNWDQIKGKWKQAKGVAQQKWGKLTNDDLDVIAGKREELVGGLRDSEAFGVWNFIEGNRRF